jgi:phosphatidylglycerophosphate synthase
VTARAGETYAHSLARLGSAQKGSSGAPAYSRFVNRRLGRYLAASAYQLGMTPNQVTAVSALFTFAGIAVIAFVHTSLAAALAVVVLLVVGYALDSADGQLARLRGGGSAAGEWLDHVIDATKIGVLHLAVYFNWLREPEGRHAILGIPLAYEVVAAIAFFAIVLTDQLRRAQHVRTGVPTRGSRRTSALYSLAVVPTDYGLMCLAFVLLAWPFFFTVAYVAFFAANTLYLALALPKWFRELKGLGELPDAVVTRRESTTSEVIS